MSDIIAEAHRLAREGYGWHDLAVKFGLSERRARQIVFGKAAAAMWERRVRARRMDLEKAS